MRNLDIAEVAERSGLPASALRYYEEKGLIRSIGRRGLRRVFPAGVVERLALIALGRAAGFSLEEMARMFTRDGRLKIDRGQLAAKAKELDATIRRTRALVPTGTVLFMTTSRSPPRAAISRVARWTRDRSASPEGDGGVSTATNRMRQASSTSSYDVVNDSRSLVSSMSLSRPGS